jgi:hypothetical protein
LDGFNVRYATASGDKDLEANAELEKITAFLRSHPDMLKLRWPF